MVTNKLAERCHRITNGFLLACEGIDGSGKSVLAQALYAALMADGYATLLTREPGATVAGKQIRKLLQAPAVPLFPRSQFLLYAADRADHFEREVIPALKEGTVVVSDRMADSSVAYQGYGQGLPVSILQQINTWAMNGRTPNLTIYLAVDYQTVQQRMGKRGEQQGGGPGGFDTERAEFFERVLAGYRQLYAGRSDVITIDARQSQQECFQQAYDAIKKVLVAHE